MKKITTLTHEETERLAEYREKWIKIGLSTNPIDRAAVTRALEKCYQVIGKECPRFIIILDSPLAICVAIGLLRTDQVRTQVRDQVRTQVSDQVLDQVSDQVRTQVRTQVRDQVRDQVRTQVSDQVLDQVRTQVRDQVLDQVSDQVRDQVSDQVRTQVRTQVRDQVRTQVLAQVLAQVLDQVLDQVSDQVRTQVRTQVRDQVSDQVLAQVRTHPFYWDFGQFEAFWLSFYDYFTSLGIDTKKLAGQIELACTAGWSILFWEWAFISARPCEIHRDGEARLHREDGPAVLYPDGFSVYALNGVRVPADLVETPTADLDARRWLTEKNVEIRREFIRKVGIDSLIELLGARVIDTQGEYQLLTVKLTDELADCRYLKMLNPSIGVFHVEGVDPECSTVSEAIVWRNQSTDIPSVLT